MRPLRELDAAEKLLESNREQSAFQDQYSLAVIAALRATADGAPDDLAAKAVEFLRHASDHGFRNGARLRRDPAFRVLRDLPEFQNLVKKLE